MRCVGTVRRRGWHSVLTDLDMQAVAKVRLAVLIGILAPEIYSTRTSKSTIAVGEMCNDRLLIRALMLCCLLSTACTKAPTRVEKNLIDPLSLEYTWSWPPAPPDVRSVDAIQIELADNPADADLRRKLAMSYYAERRFARAAKEFEENARLRQLDRPTSAYYGVSLAGTADFEGAAEFFEDMASNEPDPVLKSQALSEAGGVWLLARNATMAERLFAEALDIDESNDVAMVGSAVLALRNDDADKAIQLLKIALQVVPDERGLAQVRAILGVAYGLKGDRQGASEEFKTALSIDGTNALSIKWLARLDAEGDN